MMLYRAGHGPSAPLIRRDDFSHKAMAINALNSRIIVLRSEWRLK